MQGRVTSGDVTGASAKTILANLAPSNRRLHLKQVEISCTDTPADATAIFDIGFITADGTGTGVTPVGVEGQGVLGTAKKNYTVEPTYAANKLSRQGINQRVSKIWNAPFDGDYITDFSGGTNVGIGIRMVSGPALNYSVDAQWEE
jgi:hypothetical protein